MVKLDIKKNKLIYGHLFLAVLCLHGCTRGLSLAVESGGPLFVWGTDFSGYGAWALHHAGSAAVAQGLNCSLVCGLAR